MTANLRPLTPPTWDRSTANAQVASPLRKVSNQLEALFLAEMLKATQPDGDANGFSGGAGEAQFTSFLQDAQAQEMVRAGGIGLAESLFNALKERENGTTENT